MQDYKDYLSIIVIMNLITSVNSLNSMILDILEAYIRLMKYSMVILSEKTMMECKFVAIYVYSLPVALCIADWLYDGDEDYKTDYSEYWTWFE